MIGARPSIAVSTVAVLLMVALWAWLLLVLMRDYVFPLTFVLPMLICVWTRRPWQVWMMAAAFLAMAYSTVTWTLPDGALTRYDMDAFFAAMVLNALIGAVVVQALVRARERLEARSATIIAQNTELEAQAAHLARQNEEMSAQAEELAERSGDIARQAVELSHQNEELAGLNARLAGREAVLESLLATTREDQDRAQALQSLCDRTLALLGQPAAAAVILEQNGSGLMLRSRSGAGAPDALPLPAHWPLEGSLGDVVLRERRTACVSDLRDRPDLSRPFGNGSPVQSLLATPLPLGNSGSGLLVACSTAPGHWTDEQFHVIEWIAAHCGLMLEGLQAREAVARHTQALETAHQSKDRFLAMLSHELRTPLTPVLAIAASLAEDTRLPEDAREHLTVVRRNVAIQSRLIDDLLDLTLISRGKVKLERQRLKAPDVLRSAAQIVDEELRTRSQELVVDLLHLDDCVLVGDGARLQQVFWNLLKNASKFSPNGSRIGLRAKIDERWLCVDVYDQGVGIDPQDADRIFLPFEQGLDMPRPGSDSGLGLGLAIAKAVVDLHGGSISVQSEGRGHGATFTVKLPTIAGQRAEADSVNGAADEAAPSARSDAPAPLRLLLVEDHVDTGWALATLLVRAGHVVDHAKTAAEAMQFFQDKEYDVVLSDLGLPDESGLVLMPRFLAQRPGIRGICMSGYGMDEDLEESRRAGFIEHLTKPVDLPQLMAAIARSASPDNTEAMS